MDVLKKYKSYYQAFEDAYDSDNWSAVSSYFTDDAIYESPMTGQAKGKENVMNVFSESLNRFDRQFSVKRTIENIDSETIVEDNYLKIVGIVTYSHEGIPDLKVTMDEELWFKNELIEKIVDTIDETEMGKIQQHLEKYGDKLK